MFSRIYALPIGAMIFLAVAGTFFWVLTGLAQESRVSRAVKFCLLVLVTFFILHSTLLGRHTYEERRLSLMPFASFEHAKIQPEVYRSLLLNILMFLTFGLGLGWVLPDRWKLGRRMLTVILTGFVLSLAIEILQYWLLLGYAETDDVIFNTLGCVLAAGALIMRDRLRKKTKQ